MSTYMRCPKCGTRDDLVLIEVHEEIGYTDPGRHEVCNGAIIPAGLFIYTFGDPIGVKVECRCGHSWRSRKPISA